jgi:hypothetical protein
LDKKDHGELGMNDRLLNIDDVQVLFKEQLGHFRNDPNLIFSNHRDDIKIFLFEGGVRTRFHRICLSQIYRT